MTVEAKALSAAVEPLAPPLADEWEVLADAAGASLFAHPGWVAEWSRKAGIPLSVVTVRRHGSLAAVLPIVSSGAGVRTAADWEVPHASATHGDEEALQFLARHVAGSGHTQVVLDFVDAGGPTYDAIFSALREEGYRTRVRTRARSPFVDCQVGWDSYRRGLSSRKLRELRRRMRRLAEVGEVAFTVHDGAERLDALLDEGLSIEGSGWKEESGTAIVSDPAVELFYRGVARWAASRGFLRLAFLRLDARAVAFDFALETTGQEWLLKTGFDPAFRRYAPGMQLRYFALEQAFARGLATYEFAGSADPWKLEWADSTRRIVTVDAFAPTFAGSARRVISAITRRGRALRRRLVHQPRLTTLAMLRAAKPSSGKDARRRRT